MASTKSNWKISDFIAHGQDVLCAALSPSNGRTLATGGEDKRVNLWLVGQPRNITSISGLSSPVESVVFNNTDEWLGAGSRSGTLKIFDLNENKVVRSISGHKAGVRCLDFHRYGDVLASGSMDTNIKLWDVRHKGCLYTYKGHREAINAVQFSPDGKWVVSASSDKVVRLWDLNAAKCLKEFTSHTAAVNDVRFHPKELLLATASSDRTIQYWDLEQFFLVSSSPPEGYGVRKILFHPDGDVLFSATQDSLRVHSWEPSSQLDYLPISWGKIASIQLSGDQLIGASHFETSVSLWCVDIKKLKPWSIDTGKRGCPSARQQFRYQEEVVPQRPPTQPSGPPPAPLDNESEGGAVGGDSPPTEVKPEERVSVFKSREELVRTPPKQVNLQPFLPPETGPNDPTHLIDPPIKDFLPNPRPSPQSRCGVQEIKRDVNEAHSDVCSILRSRLNVLQEARTQWSISEPRVSLEVVINSGNQPAIVDILSILNLKRSLWTLDMSVLVLSELRLLLRSKHENHIICACNTLKLILKSFSSVIVTNVKQPGTPTNGGIDIAREERLEKCQTCFSHLQKIRQDLHTYSPSSYPLLTRICKEQKLHETFELLD